jgi:uncharacterized membrane protein
LLCAVSSSGSLCRIARCVCAITRYAALSGTANAVGNALLMYALTLLFVPYVIAIKRMSALFTVIVSGIILKENIRGRLVGTVIMLMGTVLIAFADSRCPGHDDWPLNSRS